MHARTTFGTASLAIALLAGTGTSHAVTRGSVGIGIAVGSPTALDVSLGGAGASTFDFGIGSDDELDLAVYGEAEFPLAVFGTLPGPLGRIYLGGGGQLSVYDHEPFFHDHHDDDVDHAHVDAVMPFGFDLAFRAPIQLFAELRPSLALLGHPIHLHVGGQIGARVLF